MNVSSIIIKVDLKFWEEIISSLGLLEGVEVGICEKQSGTIIVTITAEDISKEIAQLKNIEAIAGVLSANMHYSYSEEEFEKNLSAQEIAQNIQKSEDAKEIIYRGNVDTWLSK